MIRRCDNSPSCGGTYDDAVCWTTCPHTPLGTSPKPFHPKTNPNGYCREHDLIACPNHGASARVLAENAEANALFKPPTFER